LIREDENTATLVMKSCLSINVHSKYARSYSVVLLAVLHAGQQLVISFYHFAICGWSRHKAVVSMLCDV